LFLQLKGSENIKDSGLLHSDLIETVAGEGVNCKLIAKEIFQQKNLEEMT